MSGRVDTTLTLSALASGAGVFDALSEVDEFELDEHDAKTTIASRKKPHRRCFTLPPAPTKLCEGYAHTKGKHMSLRVVGAGIGRTGTHSLKNALELLLGAPCYHMAEVFEHPEHVPAWNAAIDREPVDWPGLMQGYAAAVDWPVAAFWRELAAEYPDAIVLLSTRASADAWWKSASETIFEASRRAMAPGVPPDIAETMQMPVRLIQTTFTPDLDDEAAAKRAYDAHNAAVRAEVPAERLVDWQPGDGWEPICTALGVPVPTEPFPHVNSTEDFRAMLEMDS